jgi:hypothetical protein
MAKRPYGSGSLTVRRGKWFGQWRARNRQVGRVIGPVRQPATSHGYTRAQAERALRVMMEPTYARSPLQALA